MSTDCRIGIGISTELARSDTGLVCHVHPIKISCELISSQITGGRRWRDQVVGWRRGRRDGRLGIRPPDRTWEFQFSGFGWCVQDRTRGPGTGPTLRAYRGNGTSTPHPFDAGEVMVIHHEGLDWGRLSNTGSCSCSGGTWKADNEW